MTKLPSLLLIVAFVLSACGSQPATPPSVSVAETPLETEAVSEVQPEADECVACHTDKQRLIDTAKPEEAGESESKGVG